MSTSCYYILPKNGHETLSLLLMLSYAFQHPPDQVPEFPPLLSMVPFAASTQQEAALPRTVVSSQCSGSSSPLSRATACQQHGFMVGKNPFARNTGGMGRRNTEQSSRL